MSLIIYVVMMLLSGVHCFGLRSERLNLNRLNDSAMFRSRRLWRHWGRLIVADTRPRTTWDGLIFRFNVALVVRKLRRF